MFLANRNVEIVACILLKHELRPSHLSTTMSKRLCPLTPVPAVAGRDEHWPLFHFRRHHL